MPTRKKIREIKIEVERIRVISNLKKPQINCEHCQNKVEFLSISEAAKAFEIHHLTIFQMAEDKRIHIKLDSSNEVLICLNSLLSALNNF